MEYHLTVDGVHRTTTSHVPEAEAEQEAREGCVAAIYAYPTEDDEDCEIGAEVCTWYPAQGHRPVRRRDGQ